MTTEAVAEAVRLLDEYMARLRQARAILATCVDEPKTDVEISWPELINDILKVRNGLTVSGVQMELVALGHRLPYSTVRLILVGMVETGQIIKEGRAHYAKGVQGA